MSWWQSPLGKRDLEIRMLPTGHFAALEILIRTRGKPMATATTLRRQMRPLELLSACKFMPLSQHLAESPAGHHPRTMNHSARNSGTLLSIPPSYTSNIWFRIEGGQLVSNKL